MSLPFARVAAALTIALAGLTAGCGRAEPRDPHAIIAEEVALVPPPVTVETPPAFAGDGRLTEVVPERVFYEPRPFYGRSYGYARGIRRGYGRAWGRGHVHGVGYGHGHGGHHGHGHGHGR